MTLERVDNYRGHGHECIDRPTFSPASKYEVASTLITRSGGDDGGGAAGRDAGGGCIGVNAAIVLSTLNIAHKRAPRLGGASLDGPPGGNTVTQVEPPIFLIERIYAPRKSPPPARN